MTMGWVAVALNYVEIVWVIASVALVQILYAATARTFATLPKFVSKGESSYICLSHHLGP